MGKVDFRTVKTKNLRNPRDRAPLTMFHICRTIRRHFSLRQVKLCIGQRKYKQKFTTQGRIDRSTDQASEFALAHLTPILHFCKIVVKMI